MMSYGGFEIEDSIQMDGGAVDRGFMNLRSVVTKQIKINSASNEEFIKPDQEITRNYNDHCNYNKIGENGLPRIGVQFQKGDILVGKVKRITKTERDKLKYSYQEYIDKSVRYDYSLPGTVTNVNMIENVEGRKLKIRILILQNMHVGDKGAVNSAQKFTVSKITNVENMPYTEDGRRVQMILNPTCIIKRMTLSQMLSGGLGLIAQKTHETYDCSTFNMINFQTDIVDKLRTEFGVKDVDLTTMYNGYTGEKMKHKIAVFEVPILRLQHLVHNKSYGRSTGSVNEKTRQPAYGRSKGGGLRMSELQRDSMTAHGAINLRKESMFDHSDTFEVFISEDTGHYCIGNQRSSIYRDNVNNTNIAKIRIPWVTHLTKSLIESLGVSVRYKLKSKTITQDDIVDVQTVPWLTKFEYANLLGVRATQLERSAPPRVEVLPNGDNPLDIAKREFDAGKLSDYCIYRKMPGFKYVKVRVGDLRSYQ